MQRLTALVLLGCTISSARADLFDQYTRNDLSQALTTPAVSETAELTSDALAKLTPVLPGENAAFLIVRTGQGRLAKLLVLSARQKFGDRQVPLLLIERYATYKDGQERAIYASGANVQLYGGLHLHLDLGQVLPAEPGGDLHLQVTGDGPRGKWTLKPANGAKLYLVKTAFPATAPAKSAKVIVGETFESNLFNGVYKLHDDGRRFGLLSLEVDAANEVSGVFTSDKNGQKYDVKGKIGPARHAIQFTIKFPQVEQTFTGHLFTGDARALAGTTKLQEREAAFYATRVED